MTREHKLALIVGFSVVLLAGILLSEFASKARRDRKLPEDLISIQAAPINPPREAEFVPLPPERDFPGPIDSPSIQKTRDEGGVIDGTPEQRGTPEPAPPLADINPRNLRISAGREQAYTFKEGDTLYKLASRNYRDGALYQLLAEYNQMDPGARLRPGRAIKLPPKDVLKGEAILAPTASPREGGTARGNGGPLPGGGWQPAGGFEPSPVIGDVPAPPKPLTAVVTTARDYEIQEFDTFSSLAQRHLGSRTRTDEIVKLNPGVNPKALRIGTRIKLPVK